MTLSSRPDLEGPVVAVVGGGRGGIGTCACRMVVEAAVGRGARAGR